MAAGVITSLTGMYMTASGLVDPNAWPYLVLGIFAGLSPAAQWLAFFPTDRYRDWIRGAQTEAS